MFRDDPNLLTVLCSVSRQDTRAVNQRIVVGLPIFFIKLAPIPFGVTSQELIRRLSAFAQHFQATGSGDDLTKSQQWAGSDQRKVSKRWTSRIDDSFKNGAESSSSIIQRADEFRLGFEGRIAT